ncbi:gliding motility-associated C-terminal domain-containing protein [Flavobacterium aquidurense]|uniref:gliding motility-associated C-terminal domain-containing protein n=1 Tax=Flavobacterium aquidurense TaxID=362413 RepID=UPI00285B001B|nr:gliding motility-associated C-terminal domain-containing protein [Flavobacterium aquidurense]MDR7370871.1 gliding motility-associated-like protein [Flavobacterium aquidurense]
MVKNYTNFLQFILFFIVLSFLPTKLNAQCAGDDGSLKICDIENPIHQSISLFSLLGGSPTPGGTWSDDNNSKGLDKTNGILNAQLIRSGGVYHYTYTAPDVTGCLDNKATVEITIGAYAGVPAPYATECSSKKTFNLFAAFNSTVMRPHANGTWRNSSGDIVDAIIPITGLSGSFDFIYTVPAVTACSPISPSVKVTITIFRAPEPGDPQDLLLCGDTDLGGYTDFDLHTLLSGEDLGGEWRGFGFTSTSDHHVDLQKVFDVYGAGTYNYTYTVLSYPDNRICPDETSVISITLEKRLDFTGAKIIVESDICEDKIPTATYLAKITKGPEPVPNGEYEVTFHVSGPNGGSETVIANFVNGELSFPIKSSYFKQVGVFNINVTNIAATASKKACLNIINNLSYDLKIHPLPHLDGAILTPDPTCQNKKATIKISGATKLLDGEYDIVYNVTGDNFATGQTAHITAVGGVASFEIPANLNVKSGVSNITITKITNSDTGCTNIANAAGSLIINPLPVSASVKVQVDDFCFTDQFPVTVTGLGNLTNATLSYTLSDSNSSTLQTVILAVTNGSAKFIIPSNLLANTGSTLITANNLKNNITTCDVDLSNVSDGFFVKPIPATPVAAPLQPFCKVDAATVADLVPNGPQYKWYISATATTPLADSYVLKDENYYVREIALGCPSSPTLVTVKINDTPAPELVETPNFCGLTNPTIADLSGKTNSPSTVVWYDAEVNGNLLPSSTPLIENGKYFGFDFSTTNCPSSQSREVVVSLTNCDEPKSFFIPDGFSPNGDNVNDVFVIPNIEFVYPDYVIEIFNRYGNGMYKGGKDKPGWDGINYEAKGISGGVAPNGVYFYVIHFNKDNKPPQQGHIYLNR